MRIYSIIYKIQYNFRIAYTGGLVWIKNFFKGKKVSINSDIIQNPKKVLFVTAGLIGDTTMSVPAIIEARKIWPESQITMLGKKSNIDLLSSCPHIDEYYETPVIPFSLTKKSAEQELLRWLKAQQFDIAIILLGDQFANVLYKAGIPVRVGVKNSILGSCLTHRYDIGSPSLWTPAERLNSLRCLGFIVKNTLPALWTENVEIASELPNAYVVLHPFGSTRRQWWNINEVPELASEIYKLYKVKTVLIGGKETSGIIPLNDNIVDTTGKLSLKELKIVISKADFIISTDSGPFHIAGALGKVIIGLFRSRRPELAGIFPKGHVILGQNETCQQKCKWDECRELHCAQLYNISTSQVVDKIESIKE